VASQRLAGYRPVCHFFGFEGRSPNAWSGVAPPRTWRIETVTGTPRPLLAPGRTSHSMGREPTLSVIIATHQVATLVPAALESALEQSRAPHEVVVCDDGSTDDIEAAVAPFSDRIVFFRKEHGGEASAKNAAAAAASGDFVVILDADDVFFPERLEAIAAAAAARPDLDVITTDAYLEVEGRIVRRCYNRNWRFEVENQRRELLRRNFVFGLAAVRRDVLLGHGGFDESILWTTDWDCWLRLSLSGSQIGCIDEPLALYRLREDSLSARREEITRGKIATLEKARARDRLTDEERKIADASTAVYRRELDLLTTRDGIASGDPRARRRARAIALGRGVPLRARLDAGSMALAPARAARRIRREDETSWIGAGGIRVRRSPNSEPPQSPLRGGR
jgi:glycosyltransferase involved in cell wall biosynthesis